MATQRGTVTMTGSADLKSQCALRIGVGVAKADAQLIVPDDARIAADFAARGRVEGSAVPARPYQA
jgi:hypothetical protein